jgi:histidinol-phosphate aminotransferase
VTGPTPRPGILDLAPYVGGESKAPGAARIAKLSSNEGALGPSPRAIEAYKSIAHELHRYPDGSAAELRKAIAEHNRIDAAKIVCGAGSDEIIQLLIRAYAGPGDEIVHSRHGFLIYSIFAQGAGVTPIAAPEKDLTADVDAMLAAVTPRTKIVFIANPNNPTGTYIPVDQMARLHAGLPPHVILAIDSAYAEFVGRDGYSDGHDLVEKHGNVVMMRTFSKIYALGSLRLGWSYASPAITDVLNRLRGPFNVNGAALAAGVAALNDAPFLAESRRHNEVWRAWFGQQLKGLGLSFVPSVANFLLVKFPTETGRNADAAFEHLKSRGVIARKMGAYGLPAYLRISIGPEEDLKAAVAALADFLG